MEEEKRIEDIEENKNDTLVEEKEIHLV